MFGLVPIRFVSGAGLKVAGLMWGGGRGVSLRDFNGIGGSGEVHLCDRKGLFMQVTNVITKDGLKLLKKGQRGHFRSTQCINY